MCVHASVVCTVDHEVELITCFANFVDEEIKQRLSDWPEVLTCETTDRNRD